MALSECNTTTNLHRKELVEHGDIPFPIACYEDDLTSSDVPWHWHDEFEFAIVSSGSADFLLENHRITLKKGDGIFINSKALHAVKNTESTFCGLHSAVFHPRLVGGTMDSCFWQTLIQPLLLKADTLRFLALHKETDWQARILEGFEQVWESIRTEPYDYENFTRYRLSADLRTILQHLELSEQKPSEQDTLDAQRIRAMLEYIENRYDEELTIEDIASSVSVSSSVCIRCFRRMIGNTPIQYLKQLRLQKAAELLTHTGITAKEAAMDAGFNDVSYFTKAFREKYGVTPKEYQKKQMLL